MARILILGQGIAGTLLALELARSGSNITVADPGKSNTSSRVSAGMLHPVTGRNLVKSWKADEILPVAVEVYRRLEQLLGVKFFYPQATLELYRDAAHRNEWNNKSADPSYSRYIGTECKPDEVPAGIKQGIGGRWIENGGWVNAAVLLGSARSYLEANHRLILEEISEEEITFHTDHAVWEGQLFDFVIDCRGEETRKGNWFSHLPFNPAKGELIEIECPQLVLGGIIHKSVKIIPSGKNFLCGATYSWAPLDNIPTESAREELQKKLKSVLELPYTIVRQRAGVRPSTNDRRPLTGKHPEFQRLYIFNGLGSKGFMLAPWLAAEVSAHLLEGKPLPAETNISRFRDQMVS